MALKDVLAPVNTVLTTNGALSATPGTPPLELGSSPKRDRTATPRVTWVPVHGDRFLPPSAAVRRADLVAAANAGTPIARPLHIRVAAVEAHIWAGAALGSVDDYSATETLVQAVISALHHVAYGAYELQGGGWLEPRSSEGNLLGHRYVLRVGLLVPVLEVQDNAAPQPGEVVKVTVITATDQMGPIPPGNTTTSITHPD